ncbi:MAG: LysM peptidoglycan-binding domain-containing protein [Spirosomataceae bacterium]
MRLLCSTLILLLSYNCALAGVVDSLRTERRNGKNFIVHQIESGETISALLKRYGCSKNDFYASNPELKGQKKLSISQLIYIPTKKAPTIVAVVPEPKEREVKNLDENGIEVIDIPEATPKKDSVTEPKQEPVKVDSPKVVGKKAVPKNPKEQPPVVANKPVAVPAGAKVHTVAAKENLYTIGKKYNVYVWQIRQWNNLKSDTLKLNQKLVIQKTNTVVAAAKPKNDTAKVAQGPAGEASKGKPTTGTPTKANPIPNAGGGRKVTEEGIAEAIGSDNTTKLLALHPTAPIGTLIQVKNSTNGASVWVKVIGKLPSGDAAIRLSPKAFEKLQAGTSKRIRVNISYVVSQ